MAEPINPPAPWKTFRATARHHWMVPLLFIEWCSGHVAAWLSHRLFVGALEYLGKLSLIAALLVYLWQIPERQKASEDAKKSKHYVAWQTLNSAAGKPGNAGRSEALQDLNEDGISLVGVDLSGGANFFTPLVLTNAKIAFANFSGAKLDSPDFSAANLSGSIFADGYCFAGQFQRALLSNMTMSNYVFFGCDFQSNSFENTKIINCSFKFCNFGSAKFETSSWTSSWCSNAFSYCNFAHASMPTI